MFYYSKCSQYKKDLKNIQTELEELRNLRKTKENEWRLEKSALEVCKLIMQLLAIFITYIIVSNLKVMNFREAIFL